MFPYRSQYRLPVNVSVGIPVNKIRPLVVNNTNNSYPCMVVSKYSFANAGIESTADLP